MPDKCPLLEAEGIRHSDNSTRGHEICENCPLEKCIYDVKVGRGKSRQQYIQIEAIKKEVEDG